MYKKSCNFVYQQDSHIARGSNCRCFGGTECIVGFKSYISLRSYTSSLEILYFMTRHIFHIQIFQTARVPLAISNFAIAANEKQISAFWTELLAQILGVGLDLRSQIATQQFSADIALQYACRPLFVAKCLQFPLTQSFPIYFLQFGYKGFCMKLFS